MLIDQANEFIELFNQVSEHLVRIAGVGAETRFGELVRVASDTDPLVRRYAELLKEYANLRNDGDARMGSGLERSNETSDLLKNSVTRLAAEVRCEWAGEDVPTVLGGADDNPMSCKVKTSIISLGSRRWRDASGSRYPIGQRKMISWNRGNVACSSALENWLSLGDRHRLARPSRQEGFMTKRLG